MTFFVSAHLPLLVFESEREAAAVLQEIDVARADLITGFRSNGQRLKLLELDGQIRFLPTADPPDPDYLAALLRAYLDKNRISFCEPAGLETLVELVEKSEAAFWAQHDELSLRRCHFWG
jgi:hypothetical protein